LNFPVPTSQLQDWLPHRGPAVWVDEVLSVTAEGGDCRILLKNSANYADGNGGIRESSFIEWMAQGFGYVCACQAMAGIVSAQEKPKKAFLVQVSDFESNTDPESNRIVGGGWEGDWMIARVRRTHQVGPIALVEGEIISSKNVTVARAKLKVFAA
jgi:hypothetical protein